MHFTVLQPACSSAAASVWPLQAWPGAEKRATLIQLIDKWRASKVGCTPMYVLIPSRPCQAVCAIKLGSSSYMQLHVARCCTALNACRRLL